MTSVSVIVAVYNVHPYVEKCVSSLLDQKCTDIELILVDDGSTDASGELCDAFADRDNRVVVIHRENGGLSAARNSGLRAASGDYVLFVDGDDWVGDNTVRVMLERALALNADVVVSGFFVDTEDSTGRLLSRTGRAPRDLLVVNGVPSVDLRCDEELVGIVGYAWNKLYRRELLVDYGIEFEERLSLVEDVVFNQAVFAVALRTAFIEHMGVHYVQRPRPTLGTATDPSLLHLRLRAMDAACAILGRLGVSRSDQATIWSTMALVTLKGLVLMGGDSDARSAWTTTRAMMSDSDGRSLVAGLPALRGLRPKDALAVVVFRMNGAPLLRVIRTSWRADLPRIRARVRPSEIVRRVGSAGNGLRRDARRLSLNSHQGLLPLLRAAIGLAARILAKVHLRRAAGGDLNDLLEELSLYSPAGTCPVTPTSRRPWAGEDPTCMVSVVVPVYNAAHCLDALLDSLLGQKTSYSFEVICVDDGSNDDSLHRLNDRAAQAECLRVVSQKNQGISGARNAGIDRVRGKYVLLVDNDDLLDPLFLEKTVSAAEATRSEVVVTGFSEYDSDRLVEIRVGRTLRATFDGELGLGLTAFEGFVWGSLFDRRLFENVQFPHGYWYEDMVGRMLLFRLARGFTSLGEVLYTKNQHSSNAAKVVWSHRSTRCLDQINLLRQVVGKADDLALVWNAGARRALLHELGPMLFLRTRGLRGGLRRKAFLGGCQIWSNAASIGDEEDMELSEDGDLLIASLESRNYPLWLMVGWRNRLGARLWHAPAARGLSE